MSLLLRKTMTDLGKSQSSQSESSYLECMTRSLFSGLAVFSLGSWDANIFDKKINMTEKYNFSIFAVFSGTYFAQKLIRSKFPYSQKTSILLASVVAIGSSYKVTKERIDNCNLVRA